jgi:hypothetical protein
VCGRSEPGAAVRLGAGCAVSWAGQRMAGPGLSSTVQA